MSHDEIEERRHKERHVDEERRHTPESVMRHLVKCETEVGQQIEGLNDKFNDHKESFDHLKEEWTTFQTDFAEMLTIFRSAKGFFRVLGWIGIGVRWIIYAGLFIGAIIAFIKTGQWHGVKLGL